MASEVKRAISRIGANYARLGTTLVCGVVLVPVLLAWLGSEAFGLITLVGASVGIGAMVEDLTRQSLIRELGAAHHKGDREAFKATYAAAYRLTAMGSLLTLVLFVLLGLVVGLYGEDKVARSMVGPARWMILAEGGFTFFLVLLAPAFNMYVVTERFVLHSLWIVLRRVSYLAAALILYLGFAIEDTGVGIKWYGILAAGMNTVVLFVAVGWLMLGDRIYVPRLGMATRESVREIAGTFGWNSAVITAINLHERLPQFIMTAAFGLVGNAAFGLAMRLAAYVRMATLGITFGLDAVSARLEAGNRKDAMKQLVHHATRLHALTALPGGLAVFVLAEPLLQLWIGRHVDNPESIIPGAVILTQILMFATVSRAICDGWMRILYGAGHVRKYAPLVLVGGVINPLVALGLLAVLPDELRFNAPALAFAIVFTVVHMIMLPVIGAKCLDVRYRDLFLPMVRPAVATAIAAPVLIGADWLARQGDGWTFMWLVGTALSYGAVMGVLTLVVVATADDRRQLKRLISRSRPQKNVDGDSEGVSGVK